MPNETTGQIVIADSDSGVGLYEDTGSYPGCRPEANVRRLRTIKMYERRAVNWRDIPDNEGYGCGWGSVTRLHPVTPEQIAVLDAKERDYLAKLAAARARNRQQEIAEAADRKAHPDKYPCPRCGTYCYGDCAAH